MEKLWIDDVRTPPDLHDSECSRCALYSPCIAHANNPTSWEWVKTAAEAKEALATGPRYDVVSFDNDLGTGNGEGYQIADWLEAKVHMGIVLAPKLCKVHSMNPVASERIRSTLQRFTLVE